MAKKYLKNENGIVRAITSDNLGLEKPLLNENYDIEVHNRNMDKIDNAIQEVKGKIDGLELVASNVKMLDGTTVEDTVTTNKTSILNNANNIHTNKTNITNLTTTVNNGQNHKLTQDNGYSITINSGTFDDIKTTGIYTCTNSVGGSKPSNSYTGYYFLEVISSGGAWATQRAIPLESVRYNTPVYVRGCQDGTWSSWREL